MEISVFSELPGLRTRALSRREDELTEAAHSTVWLLHKGSASHAKRFLKELTSPGETHEFITGHELFVLDSLPKAHRQPLIIDLYGPPGRTSPPLSALWTAPPQVYPTTTHLPLEQRWIPCYSQASARAAFDPWQVPTWLKGPPHSPESCCPSCFKAVGVVHGCLTPLGPGQERSQAPCTRLQRRPRPHHARVCRSESHHLLMVPSPPHPPPIWPFHSFLTASYFMMVCVCLCTHLLLSSPTTPKLRKLAGATPQSQEHP